MEYAPDSMCNVKGMDWTDGTVHNGGEAGSQTLLFVLPKAKTFAVVLTSTSGNSEEAADMLMNDLLSAANAAGAADVCKYPEPAADGSYSDDGYGDDDGTAGASTVASVRGTPSAMLAAASAAAAAAVFCYV